MLWLGRVYAEYILRVAARLSCVHWRVVAVKFPSTVRSTIKHTLHRARYRRSAHRAPRPTSGLRAYRYRGHPLKREISTFCLSP